MRKLAEIEKDILDLSQPVIDDIVLHLRRDDIYGAIAIVKNQRRSMNTPEGHMEAVMLCEHWLKDIRERARRERMLSTVERVLLHGTRVCAQLGQASPDEFMTHKLQELGRFFAVEEIEVEVYPDGSTGYFFQRGADRVELRAKINDAGKPVLLIGQVGRRI